VFPESDVLVSSAGSDCESVIISLSDSCEDGEMETSCARTMPYSSRPVPLESLTSCARTRPFPISKVNHPVKQTSDVVPLLPTVDSGRAQQSPILSEYPSGFQLHMDTESSDSEGIAQVPSVGHHSIPLSDASSLAANQSSGRKSKGADSIVEATTVAVTCEDLSAKKQNSVPSGMSKLHSILIVNCTSIPGCLYHQVTSFAVIAINIISLSIFCCHKSCNSVVVT